MNKGIEIFAALVGGFLGMFIARFVIKLALIFLQRFFILIYKQIAIFRKKKLQ